MLSVLCSLSLNACHLTIFDTVPTQSPPGCLLACSNSSVVSYHGGFQEGTMQLVQLHERLLPIGHCFKSLTSASIYFMTLPFVADYLERSVNMPLLLGALRSPNEWAGDHFFACKNDKPVHNALLTPTTWFSELLDKTVTKQ